MCCWEMSASVQWVAIRDHGAGLGSLAQVVLGADPRHHQHGDLGLVASSTAALMRIISLVWLNP
jgi:hypothetical protein